MRCTPDLQGGAVTVLAAFALCASAAGQPRALRYEVIDLGTLGGETANAIEMNNLGHAAGIAEEGEFNAPTAFLWRDGVIESLGSLNSFNTGSSARGVNDHAEACGWALAPDPTIPNALSSRPFFWSQATGIIDISPSPDAPGIGSAEAINNLGVAVGDWRGEAFRWTTAEGMALLPKLPGALFPSSQAQAINDAGLIVGQTWTATALAPAAWPLEGGVIELPTVGGRGGWARGVNEQGVIVGESQDPTGRNQPTIWIDGQAIDLGLLPDPLLDNGSAEAINERGDIVGWDASISANGVPQQGWVRPAGAAKVRLNDVIIDPDGIWDIRVPLDINDAGQIVGIAVKLDELGNEIPGVAFLLTPIGAQPDLNGDGVVNGADLGALLGAWGACPGAICAADLNADGVIELPTVGGRGGWARGVN
ncbi:MAG: hypothetical protein ACF8QF_05930, partial [Phycisphaerales bacterium]